MKPFIETLQQHKKDILDFAEKFQFKNVYLFVDLETSDRDVNKNGAENNKSFATTSLYLIVDVDRGGDLHNGCLVEAKLIELLNVDVQVIIKRNITNRARLEYITCRCISLDNDIGKIKELLDGMLKKCGFIGTPTDIYFNANVIGKRRLERTLNLAEKILKRGRCEANKYSMYQPHENEPFELTEEMIELCMDSARGDEAIQLRRTLSPLQLRELTDELIARKYRRSLGLS